MKVSELANAGGKKQYNRGNDVEEARRKMLEAGQAPKTGQYEEMKNKVLQQVADRHAGRPTPVDNTPGKTLTVRSAEDQRNGVTEPVTMATGATLSAPPVATNDRVERTETNKFIVEIKQEDGQWVAEIVYKNGAGTEKFYAKTKNDLLMQMAIGKGNGTLKVRQVIREQKLGTELDEVYTLPDNITQEDYDSMSEGAQLALVDSVAMRNAIAFKESHPEYYGTERNNKNLQKFLAKRKLPITLRNLEYAFEELVEVDEIDFRPIEENSTPSVSVATPRVEDSASATVQPTTASAAAPETVTAPQVRKRGTTGLQPGFSTGGNTELDAPEEVVASREPSVAELRSLSDAELKKRARATFKPRQF